MDKQLLNWQSKLINELSKMDKINDILLNNKNNEFNVYVVVDMLDVNLMKKCNKIYFDVLDKMKTKDIVNFSIIDKDEYSDIMILEKFQIYNKKL